MYYVISRPKTRKLNFDIVKSGLFAIACLGTWKGYVWYRHKKNIEESFNKIMDLRVTKVKQNVDEKRDFSE